MIFFILTTIFLSNCVLALNFNASVNTTTVRTIPDQSRFLSIALDVYNYYLPNNNDLNLSFIEPLAKALGPAYVRLGGTSADFMFFKDDQANKQEIYEQKSLHPNMTFTGSELDQLYNFTKDVGWKLIYDLNQLIRTGSQVNISHWNSSNAQDLINYASQRGYDMDFELGNEPEFYQSKINFSLTGAQIAEGYRDLRNLLNSNNLYKNSFIMGPSLSTYRTNLTSTQKQILEDFLSNGGGNYIDSLTFHYYYMPSNTSKLEDFLNVTIMNNFLSVLTEIKSYNHTPIWLGETSSSFGGGAVNLSDTYAAGFLWLDKLGIAALHGLDVVIREDLFQGNFALLNHSMSPLPDYWLSLLHKKLVGGSVFNITFAPANQNLRIYAASSANNNGICIYGQWMSNTSFTLDFPQITNKQVTAYILKEGDSGNLQSKSSRLNGAPLSWSTHQPGPNMRGNATSLPLTIPGYSQFFIIVNQTQSAQCPNGWYKETTTPNKCIGFVTNTMPFFAANFDCSTYGKNATLLSISNSVENNEIFRQVESLGSHQYYIGLTRSGNNWTWSNGDSSTYTNWQSGKIPFVTYIIFLGFPTNDNTKNCVALDFKSRNWSNKDCDQLRSYICQLYI